MTTLIEWRAMRNIVNVLNHDAPKDALYVAHLIIDFIKQLGKLTSRLARYHDATLAVIDGAVRLKRAYWVDSGSLHRIAVNHCSTFTN